MSDPITLDDIQDYALTASDSLANTAQAFYAHDLAYYGSLEERASQFIGMLIERIIDGVRS